MKIDYSKNIHIYYVVHFFRWLTFFGAIWVPFYQQIGLNYTQILLMFSARHISSLIFEIPSGVFADFFGRKKSIVFARLFTIVGFALIFFARGFWLAFWGNFLIGVSHAWDSGANMALVYDSLSESNKTHLFKKVRGRLMAIRNTAVGLGSLLTTFVVAYIGLQYTVLFNIVGGFVAVFMAMKLKEPPLLTVNEDKNYFKHSIKASKFITKQPAVLFVSLFSVIFFITVYANYSLQQGYLSRAGYPVEMFGIITFVFLMVATLGSVLNEWISKLIKSHRNEYLLVYGMQVITFIGLALVLNPIWGLIFIMIGQFAQGVQPVFRDHFINDRIDSKHRATTLSFVGFLNNINVIWLMPVVGGISDGFGVQMGFLTLFFILFIGGGSIFFYYFWNYKRPIKKAATI